MPRHFRVIDLVWLVGIVGLAFGVFINLMNRSRTSSRLYDCSNNMRQVGVALSAYMNTRGVFPMSEVEGTGHGRGHSGFSMITPYLDVAGFYNAYNFDVEVWADQNSTLVSYDLRILTCPENQNRASNPASQIRTLDGKGYPGNSLFAPCHFAVNWGGGRKGWASVFQKTNGQYRGVMMTVTAQTPTGPTHCIAPKDITDGLTHTLLLTEKRDSQGWAVGGWAGSEFDPWISPQYQGNKPWARKVYNGSYHSGGSNAVFCDGHAQFLSSRMDRRVWYALLTRDGGEHVVNTQNDPEDWKLGTQP